MPTLMKLWLLVLLACVVLMGAWQLTHPAALLQTLNLPAAVANSPSSTPGEGAARSPLPAPFWAYRGNRVVNQMTAQTQTATSAEFHFERFIVSPLEFVPTQVVVGDVTGDRREDIVVTLDNWTDIRVRIHEQKSDGTLAPPTEHVIQIAVPGEHEGGLELIDLDRDGLREIVVGTSSGLTVFRKTQTGYSRRIYSGNVNAHYLGVIDVNGDGFKDVFAQSWGDGADVYLGDGAGGFQGVRFMKTSAIGYNTVEIVDYTADGRTDLVLTNGQGWNKVWIYPFMQDLGLLDPVEINLPSVQTAPPTGITVEDMDLDGRPDLVISDVGNHASPSGVHIYYQGAGGGISRHKFLEFPSDNHAGRYPGALAVSDIDGNGYPDVVVMLNSYDLMAYFLQDQAGFSDPVILVTDDNPWTNSHYFHKSMTIADINSDGCPDVVLAEASSSLRIFYGRNCRVVPMRTGGPNPPERL